MVRDPQRILGLGTSFCLLAAPELYCPNSSAARDGLPLSQHPWDLPPCVGWAFVITSPQRADRAAMGQLFQDCWVACGHLPSSRFIIWERPAQWKMKGFCWSVQLSLVVKEPVLDYYRKFFFLGVPSQRTIWKVTLLQIACKSLHLDGVPSRNPKVSWKPVWKWFFNHGIRTKGFIPWTLIFLCKGLTWAEFILLAAWSKSLFRCILWL